MWLHKELALCFLQLLLVVFINAQVLEDERIVGGLTTKIENEPYIVQIFRDDNFICGGSILTPDWILTAAHCIYGFGTQPRRFKIRGGATYKYGNEGDIHHVSKIFRSSEYIAKLHINDIALLKLTEPLTLNGKTIKAIPLCTASVPVGAEVKVSGWGLTQQDGFSSNQLRSVNVLTIPHDTCQLQYLSRKQLIGERMICASLPGKDACSGDSGGPLIYNNEICGIVSFGAGCAQSRYPGVYSDVLKLKPFIDAVMQKK